MKILNSFPLICAVLDICHMMDGLEQELCSLKDYVDARTKYSQLLNIHSGRTNSMSMSFFLHATNSKMTISSEFVAAFVAIVLCARFDSIDRWNEEENKKKTPRQTLSIE